MSQFLSPPPPWYFYSTPPPWYWLSPPPPVSPPPPYVSPPPGSFSTADLFKTLIVMFCVLLPPGLIFLFFFICFRKRTTPPTNSTEPTVTIAIATEPQAQRERRGGLDLSTVQAFPVLLNSDVRKLKEAKGQTECVICMSEFEDDEILRMLPGCCHVFHLECIGTWLASRVTCPVCRISLKDYDDVQHVPH
ncbi:hypothetical protein LUZ60_005718 [Juncus effusus]|nr:hypothetical protein LUZ60_005718 [Juncus effusus]